MKNYAAILFIIVTILAGKNFFLSASGQQTNNSKMAPLDKQKELIKFSPPIRSTHFETEIPSSYLTKNSAQQIQPDDSENSDDDESGDLIDKSQLKIHYPKQPTQPASLQDLAAYCYAEMYLQSASDTSVPETIDRTYVQNMRDKLINAITYTFPKSFNMILKCTQNIENITKQLVHPYHLSVGAFDNGKDHLTLVLYIPRKKELCSNQISPWILACTLFPEFRSKKVITTRQTETISALFMLLLSGSAKIVTKEKPYKLETPEYNYYPELGKLDLNDKEYFFSDFQKLNKLYQEGCLTPFSATVKKYASTLQEISGTVHNISEIPSEIGLCTQLTSLELTHNQIKEIPHEISSCTNLTSLDLSDNKIESIAVGLIHLSSLEYVDLHDNNIKTVPLFFTSLSKLHTFYLEHNKIESIDPAIATLPKLRKLGLSGNPTETQKIGYYSPAYLKQLTAWGERLKKEKERINNLYPHK